MRNQIPAPPLVGLCAVEVESSREEFGRNSLPNSEIRNVWKQIVDVVTEPMFILLTVATCVYVVLGQWQEGVVLGVAMFLVAGISLFESVRSSRAVQALRKLSEPTVSVLRDGQLSQLSIEEVVVGDIVWLTEGQTIPADGLLLQANDCSIDEAALTGESVPVSKINPGSDLLFAGTILTSGSAYMQVKAVGEQTEFGKLGRALETIEVEKTPLQQQIAWFVRRMAFFGFASFFLIWVINFADSGDWITSLLFSLTIAMSILPEEIPVALTSYMALGAARLARFGVVTKQPHLVESLGSATVICVDKTGTITQEGMKVVALYTSSASVLESVDDPLSASAIDALAYARWASEPAPFDPMERAIVIAYEAHMVMPVVMNLEYEYPLAGIPPMMTHVYATDTGLVRVAGKGAPERIVKVCKLSATESAEILRQATELAAKGFRVLGVAGCEWSKDNFPSEQDDFPWVFKGLVSLENPPKANVKSVIRSFRQAGIAVKMITGDSFETALAVARQVHLSEADVVLTGKEVMELSDSSLQRVVNEADVFARMFPEAKLRVIRALKANGEVVAMTGDGVNDGPALKAAHIGVAMGLRGTEVAKQAASLILVHDDLGAMVKAIAQGRRIYQNLKRAISYIISIHIPIILTVTLPLLFGWRLVNLFGPVHVIFLELVMGPTCSIAFENEPAEPGLMKQKPRRLTDTFFGGKELLIPIVQGLMIASAVLSVYYQSMQANSSLAQVRTMSFVTLVLSNGWLTLVSRSKDKSFIVSFTRSNPWLWLLLFVALLLLTSVLVIPAWRALAGFTPLTGVEFLRCLLWSVVGVGWIEIYKQWNNRRIRKI